MKKEGLILLIISLTAVIISLIGIVSAQDFFGTDLQQGSNLLIWWVQDIFGPIFAFLFGSSDYLFEKVLFFFLILSFSFIALRRFPPFKDDEHTAALWVVTLAVALLSTRFLTESEFVQTILLSYTVLGVALTSGVPLIIFFFFVESFNTGILRKVLWALFLVTFVGIWASRYTSTGRLSWIYFFTGVAALIFLLFDGTIRRAMVKQQWQQLGYNNREDLARNINRQINLAGQDETNGVITGAQYRQIIHRLRKQLKAIYKN